MAAVLLQQLVSDAPKKRVNTDGRECTTYFQYLILMLLRQGPDVLGIREAGASAERHHEHAVPAG